MRRYYTSRRSSPAKWIIAALLIILAAGAGAFALFKYHNPFAGGEAAAAPTPAATPTPEPIKVKQPDELLRDYFSGISRRQYDGLYDMLTAQSQGLITRADFVSKLKNVYEGVNAEGILLRVTDVSGATEDRMAARFSLDMNTLAGTVTNQFTAVFEKDPVTGEFLMDWTPAMIFPEMNWDDTIQVKTLTAKRGDIYDCNGVLLAGEGEASSVGLVPGKMAGGSLRASPAASPTIAEGAATPSPIPTPTPGGDPGAYNPEREADVARLAELLGVSADSINNKLSASWVKDNTFVPIKTIPKDNQDLEDALLQIPGVKITMVTVRYYPLAEKASHLIGYIQNVTAEDLAALKDKGYTANSAIGKTGLESIYEDQLRARDGCEIDLADSAGNFKETLVKREAANGKDLNLTIDAGIQTKLYDLFAGDKCCSAAINPKTGAVLALVSEPAYNNNDFVMGMSQEEWDALNSDPGRPLYNRFKAALCPGSTMKPITCAIGLNTGAMTADEDFGPSGLSWQQDGSWGKYFVTTMTRYNGPANIENALIYSDNIFAAKAALKIGADKFASELKRIGFEEKIPFEFGLYDSIISDTASFTSDIQLADSGYGQGQILINPLHMSVIYASFLNNGNIPGPWLLKTDYAPEVWINNAFSPETARTILNDLIQVIERGTGKSARIPGQVLAGKTGTAEIKLAKGDEGGTELGWFVMFNADEDAEDPLMVTTMVEDVKDRGGSHYVTEKVRALFVK